jgi:biotin carboxylase
MAHEPSVFDPTVDRKLTPFEPRFDADITQIVSGVDLYARVLGVAIGDLAMERSPAQVPHDAAAVAKFLIARPGVVRSIAGVEAALAMDGVHDVQTFVPVGGRVHPLTDSAKRAAYVLAHAPTREETIARADAALATIRIDTSDEAHPGATA